MVLLACVVNGGANNGVACFSVHPEHGLFPIGVLRPLTNLHTTTPPIGPPNTVSEIIFNPSSTAVFVTIKGNPGPPAVPGWIYAFDIESNGRVSSNPVISCPPKLVMDFSISFLGSDTSALITDPTFGASIVSITPSLQVTETQHVTIPSQGASCWSVYSQQYNSVYVIDAGNPNITILAPGDGGIKGVIQYEVDALGGFDPIISRQWLYLLTKDSSIVILNLDSNGTSEVQHYTLASEGPPSQWQGMSAYPAQADESSL